MRISNELRVLRPAILCAAVSLAALTGSPGLATLAFAGQQAGIETVPFEEVFPNPCTGETVILAGELLLISHQTTDQAGGFHEAFKVVPRGVTGTGASGTRYRAVGAHSDVFNTGPGRATTFTLAATFNVISMARSSNFLSSVTVHFTANANGVETAEVEQFRTRCAG